MPAFCLAFNIAQAASTIDLNGIHVLLVLAVRLERIVMTVDEHYGSRQQAWIHRHTIARVHLNEDEAAPIIAL